MIKKYFRYNLCWKPSRKLFNKSIFYDNISFLHDIYNENILHIKSGKFDPSGIHAIYAETIKIIYNNKLNSVISSAPLYQRLLWLLNIVKGLDILSQKGIRLQLNRENIVFSKDNNNSIRPLITYYWDEYFNSEYGFSLSNSEYNFKFLKSFFNIPEDIIPIIPEQHLFYSDFIQELTVYMRDKFTIRICIPTEIKEKIFFNSCIRRNKYKRITDSTVLEDYLRNAEDVVIYQSKVHKWIKGEKHYTLYFRSSSDIDPYEHVKGASYFNATLKSEPYGLIFEVYKFGFIKYNLWEEITNEFYHSPFGLSLIIGSTTIDLSCLLGDIRAYEKSKSIHHMETIHENSILDVWSNALNLYEHNLQLSGFDNDSVEYIQHSKRLIRQRNNINYMHNTLREFLNSPSLFFSEESKNIKIDPLEQDDRRLLVQRILNTSSYFALQGPPGTGKTTIIKDVVLSLLKKNNKTRILLSTQDNDALQKLFDVVKENVLDTVDSLTDNDFYLIKRTGDVCDPIEIEKDKVINKVEEKINKLSNRLRDILLKKETYETINATESLYNDAKENILELNRQILRAKSDYRLQRLCHLRNQYFEILKEAIDQKEKFASETTLTQYESDKIVSIKSRLLVLENWLDLLKNTNILHKEIPMSRQIVAVTCNKLGDYQDFPDFDWAIIDEAAKIDPLDLMIAMNHGKKVLMVGDQNQLPPQININGILNEQSLILDDDMPYDYYQDLYVLNKDDLGKLPFPLIYDSLPDCYKGFLSKQFRMCKTIGNLVSKVFYEGNVSNGRKKESTLFPEFYNGKPLLWLSTENLSNKKEQRIDTTFFNPCETDIICNCIKRLRKTAHDIDPNIIVITGYNAQKKNLETELHKIGEKNIRVGTVDSFQGQEANVVFMSMVRSNEDGSLGFLNDLARINVAFSRAMDLLVIVGDSRFFFDSNKSEYANKIADFFAETPEAEIKILDNKGN